MKNRIVSARNDPNVWGQNPPREFTYWRYASMLCGMYHKPMPPAFNQNHGVLLATVNHGRWVTLCPYCNNGMLVCHDDPLFWCASCRMEANHGNPMRALFPKNWAELELILSMRIDPKTRNWQPGETAAELARENLAHKEGLYGLDIA